MANGCKGNNSESTDISYFGGQQYYYDDSIMQYYDHRLVLVRWHARYDGGNTVYMALVHHHLRVRSLFASRALRKGEHGRESHSRVPMGSYFRLQNIGSSVYVCIIKLYNPGVLCIFMVCIGKCTCDPTKIALEALVSGQTAQDLPQSRAQLLSYRTSPQNGVLRVQAAS